VGWTEEAQRYVDEVEDLEKEKKGQNGSKLAEMAEANESGRGLFGNKEEAKK
jgi:hypothetical protein